MNQETINYEVYICGLLANLKNIVIEHKNEILYVRKHGNFYNLPKTINLDENFIQGVSYYIGDGRTKTSRGLSTVNQDAGIIKFFLKWLKEYFRIGVEDTKIKILTNSSDFDHSQVKQVYAKKLNIDQKYIWSIFKKHGAKNHHKILIEVWVNKAILKSIFDLLIPRVKKACLHDKKLAGAYIRGIMAAEGCPRYHIKSSSRAVHLKMKDVEEINYVQSLFDLLNVKSSIYYSKSDNEWIVVVSGVYELEKLRNIDIFKLSSQRKEKFARLIQSYKRKQVKKGDIPNFYINKIIEYTDLNDIITAPEFAIFIERSRITVIRELRKLQKNSFLSAKRNCKTGRAFEFSLTRKAYGLRSNNSS